ncbi:MAG: monovalent cation/H+ antiporter subunit D family protein [Gammaproteobacteria bacterium]|nr:monovalent cation/H+ antiporter subunit D family protein [Gammaproteobacteria bacterium]
MTEATNTLIQLCILIPALTTIGIALSRQSPNLRETITVVAGISVFILVLKLYLGFESTGSESVEWIEVFPGLSISFSVEPLGLLFALIAGFLWPVTTVYAIGYMRGHHEKNQTRFYICFAIAIAAVMGIAFADNLFTLFIFYEVLTISTYPLVTHAGTDKARLGGRTYLGILMSTSIGFLLLAVIMTWNLAGTLDFQRGGILPKDVNLGIASVLLVLFMFGIGKAALMPFHRWLPAAMVAPTPVSALLHAVAVVKAGVFSVLKIAVFVFGLDLMNELAATQWLLYLAAASVLLASLVAMQKDNLKARLAYSTVGQLGYITVGALLATQAGITGGAMHIAAHAFGKITLFFCAGAILVALHKSEISDMRGIGKAMPLTMLAFFIASLGIIGLPPTGGTWSKWWLLSATFDADQMIVMIVLMISSLLNIAYLLPIPYHAFFPGNSQQTVLDRSQIKEAPVMSLVAIVITTSCTVALFFYPEPFYQLASHIVTGGADVQ